MFYTPIKCLWGFKVFFKSTLLIYSIVQLHAKGLVFFVSNFDLSLKYRKESLQSVKIMCVCAYPCVPVSLQGRESLQQRNPNAVRVLEWLKKPEKGRG